MNRWKELFLVSCVCVVILSICLTVVFSEYKRATEKMSFETTASDSVPEPAETTDTTHPVTANTPETTQTEPEDKDFVRVADYIPQIFIDLKYATADNFTKKAIYDFKDAYLRYGTVKKLIKAQAVFEKSGLYIKILDAYRPFYAQELLWEACPDPVFVANPARGYTNHNFGNTVDITLADQTGSDVEMPSPFDDFSKKADKNYSDVSAAAGENAALLDRVMKQAGFKGYSKEWWHYEDITPYKADSNFYPGH